VTYFSRKHSLAKINYEIYDKELLAIVWAFKECIPYWKALHIPSRSSPTTETSPTSLPITCSIIAKPDSLNFSHALTSRLTTDLERHMARPMPLPAQERDLRMIQTSRWSTIPRHC
jgi:hypothetical protein